MSKRAPTTNTATRWTRPSFPSPVKANRGEEGYLGYLLRQANAAHRLRMERAMTDVGVTLPQFLVLTMIRAYPGVSNADLARLAMQTPQTVSVIVANLERSGRHHAPAACRARPHPAHRGDARRRSPAGRLPEAIRRH